MREESAQYSEGIIIEEFRRGFVLGDKLLRPAMVKVSSGPPTPEGDVQQVPEAEEKVEE
jgi:molecular chaperone GrpE